MSAQAGFKLFYFKHTSYVDKVDGPRNGGTLCTVIKRWWEAATPELKQKYRMAQLKVARGLSSAKEEADKLPAFDHKHFEDANAEHVPTENQQPRAHSSEHEGTAAVPVYGQNMQPEPLVNWMPYAGHYAAPNNGSLVYPTVDQPIQQQPQAHSSEYEGTTAASVYGQNMQPEPLVNWMPYAGHYAAPNNGRLVDPTVAQPDVTAAP